MNLLVVRYIYISVSLVILKPSSKNVVKILRLIVELPGGGGVLSIKFGLKKQQNAKHSGRLK